VRYIFLLFVVVPIVEIALLIQVGSYIGVWSTVAIVILTAALGSWLLRQQGLATMTTARTKLNSGAVPATELLEGLILVFGGALLLTPGFFTDAVGFLCLLPPSRRWMASRLGHSAMVVGMGSIRGQGSTGTASPHQPGGRPRPRAEKPDVIEGEFRRED